MRKAPDSQRERRCEQCSVVFYVSPYKKGRFCSQRCKHDAERKNPPNEPRPCVVCGVVFTPSRKNGKARHCSKSCIWKATKGAEFNARMTKETASKRGDAMRGKGEGRSYRKRNGRHEHRIVAEQKIGRPLNPGEIVHHIDGNILNNQPENLEVMTQAEHMRRHGLGIKGVPIPWAPWERRK